MKRAREGSAPTLIEHYMMNTRESDRNNSILLNMIVKIILFSKLANKRIKILFFHVQAGVKSDKKATHTQLTKV